jgi:hypothetical protein
MLVLSISLSISQLNSSSISLPISLPILFSIPLSFSLRTSLRTSLSYLAAKRDVQITGQLISLSISLLTSRSTSSRYLPPCSNPIDLIPLAAPTATYFIALPRNRRTGDPSSPVLTPSPPPQRPPKVSATSRTRSRPRFRPRPSTVAPGVHVSLRGVRDLSRQSSCRSRPSSRSSSYQRPCPVARNLRASFSSRPRPSAVARNLRVLLLPSVDSHVVRPVVRSLPVLSFFVNKVAGLSLSVWRPPRCSYCGQWPLTSFLP